MLKGRAGAVIAFSEQVIAEHGVKHGRLVMVPVQLSSERHAHGDHGKRPHEHAHVSMAPRVVACVLYWKQSAGRTDRYPWQSVKPSLDILLDAGYLRTAGN